MAFTRSHWIRHRPFVYHFATLENIERIVKRGEMLSAEAIVKRAHAYDPTQVPDPGAFLRAPRVGPIALTIGPELEDVFVLNDQLPMRHETSFATLVGTRNDFIALLNSFVFCWPGNEDGPVTKGNHGQNFLGRYPAFAELRIPIEDAWTDDLPPVFCRYNSGGPQPRDGVVRGPGIFVSAQEPSLALKKVVEIAFKQRVAIPDSAEWRRDAQSDWRPAIRQAN